MLDKPTTLPKFAELDQIDPTSGENNVVAPIPTKQNYGWTFKEKPPRQHFNWLHRWTYRWLKWIDESVINGTVAVKLVCGVSGYSALDPNSAGVLVGQDIHFNMPYQVIGDIVQCVIPSGPPGDNNGKGVCGAAIDSPPADFRIMPQSTWPTEFVWDSTQRGAFVKLDNDIVSVANYLCYGTTPGIYLIHAPLTGGIVGLPGQVITLSNFINI